MSDESHDEFASYGRDADVAPERVRSADNASQVLRSLRGAKRLMKGLDEGDPAERIKLLLAEANVYALLDLADAIRGRENLSGSGG